MQLLIDILDDIKRSYDPSFGICYNIKDKHRQYYDTFDLSASMRAALTREQATILFLKIAEHWPYHSGSFNFPIPHYRKPYDASSHYRVSEVMGCLWADIQGTLRHDLIKFCHAYLTTDDFDAKSWTNEEIESYKRGEE